MDTSALAQAINKAAASASFANESEKVQLIEACTSLLSSLESSEQKLMALLFSPVKAVALRLGVDMHLFDVGAKALENGENLTLAQLNAETNCEALLIRRIMRILLELKTFKEIEQDIFQPQPMVALFKTDGQIAQAVIHFTTHLLQIYKLPGWFEERGYQCPNDPFDSPFQYAMGTELHVFDWIASNPTLQHAFNVTMTMRASLINGSKWFELYPIEQLLTQRASSDTFLVDIGGSVGHNTIALKERHPNIPGRLVIQDIAPVIDSIEKAKLPLGIEAMVHDFFRPQPVRLAKIYYLGHILHDWPDAQARKILEHVRDAMGSNSVLLLDEAIMPERDVPFVPAVMDLTMMAAYSSLERTENQFRDLLDSAGLQLVQVWNSKQRDTRSISLGQFVLEARLKL